MFKKIIFTLSAFFLVINIAAAQTEISINFRKYAFKAKLALTPQEQIKGLMFCKKLAQNRGMFFVFNTEEERNFWMKNTLIPLDIIWINKDKEVVYIKNEAPPCNDTVCPIISPQAKAMYVLELNGGVCEKIGLKTGDKLDFEVGLP